MESKMIRLSVLLPTRGRPEHLARAVASLLRDGRMPEGTELLIGADADDADLWQSTIPWSASRNIHWVVKHPFPTLAQKVNNLATYAQGSAMMVFPNDMTIGSPVWDIAVFVRLDLEPANSLLYAFVEGARDYASLPILRRSQVEELGWYAPPWFPFWFSDSWFTEIVRMSGRGILIDLGIQHQPGVTSTQGLRDLAFWHNFFDSTREERVAYAAKLRGGPVPFDLIAQCARLSAENPHPSEYAFYEANAEPVPSPGYEEAKRAAQEYLWRLQKIQ